MSVNSEITRSDRHTHLMIQACISLPNRYNRLKWMKGRFIILEKKIRGKSKFLLNFSNDDSSVIISKGEKKKRSIAFSFLIFATLVLVVLRESQHGPLS